MASLTRIEIITIFDMLSSPFFGWERSEEIPIIVWRDHGQLAAPSKGTPDHG
jgi:hypothetical protein